MKENYIYDFQIIEIENIFTYHAPKNDQQERYVALRDEAKKLAYMILRLTPEGVERTRAIHKLEEAIFLANAAIARRE